MFPGGYRFLLQNYVFRRGAHRHGSDFEKRQEIKCIANRDFYEAALTIGRRASGATRRAVRRGSRPKIRTGLVNRHIALLDRPGRQALYIVLDITGGGGAAVCHCEARRRR